MTFHHQTSHIQEGDTVIAYIHPGSHFPIVVTKDAEIHNKYGMFLHNDMIGQEWGIKVYLLNSKDV